ncbi:putative DNA-directed RNA polymerase [Helianthus annuus]|nr:putative DNA-directed RNA polymerase [Helianthus annuus]KAJ0554131.1 putative DNA-directed RNA polymerase [Helianthus annuus]KAJ0898591.1 putative DNA-directed RNA polymerase [Helianthus annuus]
MQQDTSISFTKHPYVEDVGTKRIKSIKFSMLSDADVLNIGEVEVYSSKCYGGEAVTGTVVNGLLDPRMGPPNRFSTCETCHGKFQECPGHFGYLKLALPVFNVGYISHIVNILKCICKSCSRILLSEEERVDYLKKIRNLKDHLKKEQHNKSIVKRCTAMASSKKAVTCSRCGYINGIVKKAVGLVGVIHDRSKIQDNTSRESSDATSKTKEMKSPTNLFSMLNPHKVLKLFKKMLDVDCDLLFLDDRPEKFILSVILVPPIPIRPSVRIDAAATSNENDITVLLGKVIQSNAAVREVLSQTSASNQYLNIWEDLQHKVALYINTDVRVPSSCALEKPMAGLVQRLKGKQGRFRQNLSGKRVEYTGRTVISPDPNLKITEVAIPILMAKILTYPERVSYHNIERLRQAVCNGASKYPGAKHIRKPDGTLLSLSINARKRLADELKFGDVVDRHLVNGDVVLFNRQPSLHRMSIMSHRAKIMPWRTLRFNESVCNPYNADFDGDEMNMHVPQTEEARTEALTLMGVQNNLCTPKNGEILVASTQDFLTSSFLITRKDTFYDRASFSLMCCYMGDAMDILDLPTPAILKPIELWTGKQLFSVLLRPHADMKVYLNLTVTEKSYSKPSGKRVKPYETMCPNDGYVYVHNSELLSGQLGKATLGNGNKDGLYSVLLRDYNMHAAAACMNRLAKLSARWIGNHGFSIGIDDVQPGDNLNDNTIKIISEGNKKCDNFILNFNKGKLKLQPGCNAAQTLEAEITGVLNKIRDETGKVCMEKLHWRNSPLIMSQCGSKGSPINISQMIACVGQQSVGGQRAPNGFMDRSLPHFPRDSKTPAAKGFVANSFYSGLTATEFFFHTMGGREGLVDTAVKTADTGYLSRKLIKGLEDLSIYYDNTVRDASACIVQFTYGGDGRDPSQMEGKAGFPLNFDRLLMKVKATCPAGQHKGISSSEIRQLVDEHLSMHDMTPEGGCSEDFRIKLRQFIEKYAATLEFTKLALQPHDGQLHYEQSEIIENVAQSICGITSQQLQVFLNTCTSRYHQKKIDAGTNIGAIGAQSIGEPGTQMTLKTFHFAGVASMNVTLGVPRIKEILNAAKKISTPVITAKLRSNDNVSFAKLVKSQMERTLLGQVAKSIKIILGNRSASIVISLDKSTIQALQLSIDAYTVRESILKTPRIKLKEHHIKVLDARKLEINPPSDRIKLYFDLHSLRNRLATIVVKGIGSIERAVINKKKEQDKFNLLVEGTGLQAVMGMEGINGHETTSNHIFEVQSTLGIEAARRSIIKEIQYTMESHGMSIDIRHMMLLADVMTYKGEILGMTRFGIQKMKESVLMLASFERSQDHLFNASVNGRVDTIQGVSESIIMGIPMQTGTGMIGVKQRAPQYELSKVRHSIIS